jgi:hypothetical protein
MVFSDFGSFLYNSFVPSIKSAREGISNFTEKMGGLGGVAKAAAGAAGIAALTAGLVMLDQQYKEETSKNLDDLSNQLQGVEYASTPTNEELIKLMASIGKLDELWERAKAAGDEQALAFLDLAEDAGVSREQIAEYRSELENKQAAEESGVTATDRMTEAMKNEADAIRGVNDARRAAIDPLFGMLDAMNQQRDSQREVNELVLAYHDAVKEHGEGSGEAAEALRNLNDAQDDAALSAADLESASLDLEAQIREHPASLSNARNALERWVDMGLITEGQARRMSTRFGNAADEANRIQGTRTATLNARDNASGKVINVGNRLRELDGDRATVIIDAIGSAFSSASRNLLAAAFASGGIVGGYSTAAAGGPRGNRVLVGEHGPELVNLAPGSQVHSNPDTERMLGAAGTGGGAVTLVYQGDGTPLDRALFDYFRDRIRFEHGGDVQRGLGWN